MYVTYCGNHDCILFQQLWNQALMCYYIGNHRYWLGPCISIFKFSLASIIGTIPRCSHCNLTYWYHYTCNYVCLKSYYLYLLLIYYLLSCVRLPTNTPLGLYLSVCCLNTFNEVNYFVGYPVRLQGLNLSVWCLNASDEVNYFMGYPICLSWLNLF